MPVEEVSASLNSCPSWTRLPICYNTPAMKQTFAPVSHMPTPTAARTGRAVTTSGET